MCIGLLLLVGGCKEAINPSEPNNYVTDAAGESRLLENSYRAAMGRKSLEDEKASNRGAGLTALIIGIGLITVGAKAAHKADEAAPKVPTVEK
jgi:hypothetical protein